MCDTLGFTDGKRALFGKNSDRSPNEPQVLEFFPQKLHSEAEIKATYITVPQVKETHAVLLSRPTWLWGAEIGVNDCGVAIGNEAVFTLGKYGDPALTGMDILRLALERSDSAIAAVKQITDLLEQYGQGGNCGYDHEFYYDNSFLVMDRENLYVVETCGKEWVWKKYEKASISNCLSIAADGDVYSGGKPYNFKLRHTEQVFTAGSGARQRHKQTACTLNMVNSIDGMMFALRTHNTNVSNPFAKGSVASPCMHFGGIVGDHTTSSMIVSVEKDKTIVWATGSSTPCVSLYKPWLFGSEPIAPVFGGGDSSARKYWTERETFIRNLIGKVIPEEYYIQRNELESKWIGIASGLDSLAFPEFSKDCAEEEKAFYDSWKNKSFPDGNPSKAYLKRWTAKTVVFNDESKNLL